MHSTWFTCAWSKGKCIELEKGKHTAYVSMAYLAVDQEYVTHGIQKFLLHVNTHTLYEIILTALHCSQMGQLMIHSRGTTHMAQLTRSSLLL